MNWISVKDRLPETRVSVLATDNHGGYVVAYIIIKRNGDHKWIPEDDLLEAENYDGGCDIRIDGQIKYWMPLPSSPENNNV